MKSGSILLILLVFTSCSATLLAQGLKFPASDSPTKLSATDAAARSVDLIEISGFGSVYFQKSDLSDLINVKNCVGIRFYVAMEDPKQRFADVIGVAINTDGKEIGNFLERKYHLAKPLDAHYPDEYKKMNRTTAKRCVDNLKTGAGQVEPYVAFLGIASIKALLAQANSTGMRIYPAQVSKDGKDIRSMAYGSVETTGKVVNDLGSDYLLSNLPCPVDCGDEPYLWQ